MKVTENKHGNFTKNDKYYRIIREENDDPVAKWAEDNGYVRLTREQIRERADQFVLNALKNKQKASISAERYKFETSGIQVGEMFVATDRNSQQMLNGAYNYIQTNPEKIIKWKTKNGFVELDADTIAQISNAVGEHVQSAFEKESDLHDLVEEKTTKEEIESVLWQSL